MISTDIARILFVWIGVILSFYPFWLPLLLISIFLEEWLRYIRRKYVSEQGSMVLEVRLPREITKSPQAMETFFISLWQKGSAPLHETYIKGKVRPYFSFELASIDGQVHFYIWTPPKFRELIEAQLYAQFPTIEVVEVPDYTKGVFTDPTLMPMWGCYYTLSNKKHNAIPFKTYVDFGLDKNDTDEEFKHDPLAATIEWLGSLQKGEQAWIQIIIQAHKKLGFMEGHFTPVPDWKAGAKEAIKKIKEENATTNEEGKKVVSMMNLTETQKEVITATERNVAKYPFEVGMRGIYIATKEANKIGLRVPGLIGAFRQFGTDEHFNSIGLGFFTDFDYPWQDFKRRRRTVYENMMLDAYKKRSYFQPPYKHWKQDVMIMSTEELASIYHFPGAVVTTPTLGRIESKKSDAPANLPV